MPLRPHPTGYEGNLTENQVKSLAELKERMKKTEYAEDVERDPGGDRFLLAFLRATMKDKYGERVFNVDACVTRLIATFKWRKQYGIDEIRDVVLTGGGSPAPEGWDKYYSLYPCHNVLNEETATYLRFTRFGSFITKVDPEILTPEQWVRCFAYDSLTLQHNLRKFSLKVGREVSCYFLAIDAQGLTLMGILNKMKFIQFMSNVAADHFPETLGQTFIMRCSWIFPKIFAMAKPLIDKDTLSKFVISSSVPLDALKELIPISSIPREFGGEFDGFHATSESDVKHEDGKKQ